MSFTKLPLQLVPSLSCGFILYVEGLLVGLESI